MGRRGTIIEHVPKMRSATRAFYFITRHPVAGICGYYYFTSCKRRIETRPAGTGLKFRVRAKQLVSARRTEINSFVVVVPIFILECRFCFRFAQDLKLSET